jgi:hypothetical protein
LPSKQGISAGGGCMIFVIQTTELRLTELHLICQIHRV